MARCEVCPHHCERKEGERGLCQARICRDGQMVCENYGRVSSLALDPIEKKPLNRFHPGSLILSVGSYGCNLRCPFCQNHEISWDPEAIPFTKDQARKISPEELVSLALSLRPRGNIGLAFTYNEPLVGYEYALDAARLAKEQGLCTVLVSNGMVCRPITQKLLPWIDAMNIDLKAWQPETYRRLLKGDIETVKDFLRLAAPQTHLEVTTLVIPGVNDSEEEIREISRFLLGLPSKDGPIPLHISRFFPRFRMMDVPPTPVGLIYRLAEVAKETLPYVYPGNC